MARKILIWISALISFSNLASTVQADFNLVNESETSAKLKIQTYIALTAPDLRVGQLENFLHRYNSPLTPHAQAFILAADQHQLNWRLLVAIAGVESTFGKFIPENSYNAWGWNNGEYQFKSWNHAIEHISRVMNEKYYAKGLVTPTQIAPVYAPPSQTWAKNVLFFMNEIDKAPVGDFENLQIYF